MVFSGNASVYGAYVVVVGTCVGVPQDGLYCLQLILFRVSNTSLLRLMSPTTKGMNSSSLISKPPFRIASLVASLTHSLCSLSYNRVPQFDFPNIVSSIINHQPP